MLGALEVTTGGRPLELTGARTRAVLSVLRLAALESRAEALLAYGRHRDLIAELETLTAAHPLRERFWSQRMLALYRASCSRPPIPGVSAR